MAKATKLSRKISIRLFENEAKVIDRIIRYAKTEEGEKKFDSDSHFVRACIMQGINRELPKTYKATGRPQKGDKNERKANAAL